jgi:hypothetical protein
LITPWRAGREGEGIERGREREREQDRQRERERQRGDREETDRRGGRVTMGWRGERG